MRTLALVLACGCAGLTVNKRSPGTLANGVFTPALPAAANYGSDPLRACPASGVQDEVASQLKGQSSAQPDGPLCQMAETLLSWDPEKPPPETLLNFLSFYFGLTAPVRRVIVTDVQTADPRALAQPLVDGIVAFASTASSPLYGLSTQRLKSEQRGLSESAARDIAASRVVLLTREGLLELDPLPRKLALGAQAALSGRVLAPLAKPALAISDVSGHLSEPPLSGNAFKADLRCGDKPGKIVVEIRADNQGSDTVPANFIVHCGEEPPASVSLEQAKVEEPAAYERKVLELVNAERAQAGLKPLLWDDAVGGVARSLAEARRDAMKSGGSVPSDVVQRLKAAEVMSPLILQNQAQARSADDAAARFLMSPAHRANYMSPDATHAGIGMALSADAAGKPSAVVTELFVKELPPVDVAALREKLYAELARKRRDARAPELKRDAALEEMAQKYAVEVAAARGDLPKARDKELTAPLYKSFLTVNIMGGAKNDPLEFAEEPGVLASGKLIGVGVAQGSNPVLGKNAVYVVVFIGTRR